MKNPNSSIKTPKKNNEQNDLIIPIELKDQPLKTYLSLSSNDNNNLFIYLNKTSDELNEEISQISNKINENMKKIQKVNFYIKNLQT